MSNRRQRRRGRKPALPAAPSNVRLRYPDGRQVPLELRYVGLVDGMHLWRPTTRPQQLVNGLHLEADVIPPRTRIDFGFWFGA